MWDLCQWFPRLRNLAGAARPRRAGRGDLAAIRPRALGTRPLP
jgi:hypothetical protein